MSDPQAGLVSEKSRALYNHVEDIVVRLWDDVGFRAFIDAVHDERNADGAVRMICDYAAKHTIADLTVIADEIVKLSRLPA